MTYLIINNLYLLIHRDLSVHQMIGDHDHRGLTVRSLYSERTELGVC